MDWRLQLLSPKSLLSHQCMLPSSKPSCRDLVKSSKIANISFVLGLYVHWTSFPEWIPTQRQQFIVGSLMRQRHPASLPLFSVCLNGANRNYQTSHHSLKPFCGNCHWTSTAARQWSDFWHHQGLCWRLHVQSITAVSLLRAQPCECPIVWWLSCSHAGWRHTHHSLPRRPPAKPFSEWGHIVTHTRHALLLSMHIVCTGSFSSLGAPAEGNKEFLINSLKPLQGKLQFKPGRCLEDTSHYWPTSYKQETHAHQFAKISLKGKQDSMKFQCDSVIHLDNVGLA